MRTHDPYRARASSSSFTDQPTREGYYPSWRHIAAVASLPVISAFVFRAACFYADARSKPAQPGDGDWAGLGIVWCSFALCGFVAIAGVLGAIAMLLIRHRVSVQRRSTGIAVTE